MILEQAFPEFAFNVYMIPKQVENKGPHSPQAKNKLHFNHQPLNHEQPKHHMSNPVSPSSDHHISNDSGYSLHAHTAVIIPRGSHTPAPARHEPASTRFFVALTVSRSPS